jgi:hypothetical protein
MSLQVSFRSNGVVQTTTPTRLFATVVVNAVLDVNGSEGWKCVIPDLPGPDVRML